MVPQASSVGPVQIQFDPARRTLIVTEKATNNLLSYRVDSSGRAGAPVVTPSHGQTPFGFAFDSSGNACFLRRYRSSLTRLVDRRRARPLHHELVLPAPGLDVRPV